MGGRWAGGGWEVGGRWAGGGREVGGRWVGGRWVGRRWVGGGQEVGRKRGDTEQDAGVTQGGKNERHLMAFSPFFKQTIKNQNH